MATVITVDRRSRFRDPQGNKIALFSSDPNEPGRHG